MFVLLVLLLYSELVFFVFPYAGISVAD